MSVIAFSVVGPGDAERAAIAVNCAPSKARGTLTDGCSTLPSLMHYFRQSKGHISPDGKEGGNDKIAILAEIEKSLGADLVLDQHAVSCPWGCIHVCTL